MGDEPVILVQGARTAGKSTLMRSLAKSAERAVVDLDEPETRDVVEASPSVFASGEPPVFFDEYQLAVRWLGTSFAKAVAQRGG